MGLFYLLLVGIIFLIKGVLFLKDGPLFNGIVLTTMGAGMIWASLKTPTAR
tara:strand:- start:208 stop:360 length:153 start_codon:yes stop_codon:yes gene_type:complete